MRKTRYLVLFLAVISILTGCSAFDSHIISQTNRPELLYSPIEGKWEVSEIIDSKSRFTYDEGDEFVFDIDIFATPREVYLKPEYEVQFVTKEEGLGGSFKNMGVKEEGSHVIRLLRRGRPTINILKENETEAILIVSDQVVRIKQIEESISDKEKLKITEEFSLKRQTGTGLPWAVALGIRDYVQDPNTNRAKSEYYSIILAFDGKDYKLYNEDGLLISEGTNLDHYEIKREKSEDRYVDNIYLNGAKRDILDEISEDRQADLFTVNYLSENYISLDYLKENKEPNTTSVYSTRNAEGLIQLKSDDIIRFSSDKIYDRAINTQTDMRLSNLVYNIGIYRENGIIILEGRIPVLLDGEILNREFAISGDFDIYQDKENKFQLSRRLRDKFPDMLDFYSTGDDDKFIIINEKDIVVYDISGSRIVPIDISLTESMKVVSGSLFQNQSLEKLYQFINEN